MRIRIGIFGGTFNPPHIGHIKSAEASLEQLGLDLLFVVPSGIPPHKNLPDDTPTPDMRLAMARGAFYDLQNTVLSDIEIYSDVTSYAIDTVRKIRLDHEGAEFFLLMGTDMYMTLETWRDSGALLGLVTPAVFMRKTGEEKYISEYAETLFSRYATKTKIIAGKHYCISSSLLREMLPLRKGAGYITDTNYSYIIKHRLYNAKPDWDWLRGKAHQMLDPSRIAHVDGCEAEAIKLAGRWGADINDAREAAILHDITKKLDPEEHLSILQKSGDYDGQSRPGGKASRPCVTQGKLFHSMTGAIVAKEEFGVSDTVAGAIRWHTTGRPHMSKAEKVIYIADYIEPSRDFEGVEKLRGLAYNDLDGAMIAGLEICIDDLAGRGIAPERLTLEALEDLRR